MKEVSVLSSASYELLALKSLRLDVMNREARNRLDSLKANNSPMAPEFERTLEISEDLATEIEQLMQGQKIQSGTMMREVIQKACETGEPKDWSYAMKILAHRALESHSPAFFAGAVLDSLTTFKIPDQAFSQLIPPLFLEMKLKTPGYDWTWGEELDQLQAKHHWQSAIRANGRFERKVNHD